MRGVTKVVALLIAAGLVVVALVWVAFQPTGGLSGGVTSVAAPGPIAGQDAPSQRDLDALRRTVEEERLARLALTERVDRMQAKLDASGPARGVPRFEADAERASEVSEQGRRATPDEAETTPEALATGYFDPAKLKGAGLDATEADRLRQTYDRTVMEGLELRRRLERGEIEEEEFLDAETRISDRDRAELGDEVYDLMLYAAGAENRVGVVDVMHGSPAQGVGLQPGDIILSYAGKRLFAPSDLVRATIEVEPGGTVPMVVLRGGEEHQFSVPAGSLGVAITEEKGEPHP